MNICPKCSRSRWPFAVALLITLVIAAMTWLMLGLSAMEPASRLGIAVAVFCAVGATLTHYILSCLRRHCRHGEHETRIGEHATS